MDEDKVSAFNTLYSVLYELSKVMAPFAPFLSEHLYRELSAFSEDKADRESVHLCRFPEFDLDQKAPGLEVAVTECSKWFF